ncbi:MAG: hypothetical protein IJ520_00305 [Synergistaceae bacterium]|nr:hypothetical protein [Synergistaceae bacterium]
MTIIKNKLSFCAVCFIILAYMSAPAFALDCYAWLSDTGDDAPYDLNEDCSGTGWAWNSSENKLVLDSSYTSSVFIACNYDDTVNIEVNGDVKLSDNTCGAVLCSNGSLNISGSGTLTIMPSDLASQYSLPTIQAEKDIIFSGQVSVIVSSDQELNRTIVAEYGDIIFSDNAKVTTYSNGDGGYALYAYENITLAGNADLRTESFGADGAGLIVRSGDVIVNDNARLEARAHGTGYAIEIRNGSLKANNNNVFLYADDAEHISNQENTGTGEVNADTGQETEQESDQEQENENESGNKSSSKNSGGSGCGSGLLPGLWIMTLLFIILKFKIKI